MLLPNFKMIKMIISYNTMQSSKVYTMQIHKKHLYIKYSVEGVKTEHTLHRKFNKD